MEKLSISIEDVRFYATHGVFEQEQIVGNEFSVSVCIEMPVIETIENDNLETISPVVSKANSTFSFFLMQFIK